MISPKQDMFCRCYLVSFNAAQAAREAGYSAKTAVTQAARLLSKVHIQERIAELKAEIDAEKSWNAAFVRERMRAVAERAEDEGNLSVAATMLTTMARAEGLLSDKMELTGRQQSTFKIKK